MDHERQDKKNYHDADCYGGWHILSGEVSMTAEEFEAIKKAHLNAMSIWYDTMWQFTIPQLVETLLVHMPAAKLQESIDNIEIAMKEEAKHDNGPENPVK